MALFLSGEFIPVLGLVCKFAADRIFVARDYFEALGQNICIFWLPYSIIPPRRIGVKNLWYLKHLRIDL